MWRWLDAQRLFSSWQMHLINLDTIIVGLNLIYLGLNKLHPLCWALIWIFQAQNWQIPWKFKNKTFLKFIDFFKNSKIRKFFGRLWKFPTSCNQANFDRKSEVLKWTNKIIVCLMLHCNPYHVNNKLYILRLNHNDSIIILVNSIFPVIRVPMLVIDVGDRCWWPITTCCLQVCDVGVRSCSFIIKMSPKCHVAIMFNHRQSYTDNNQKKPDTVFLSLSDRQIFGNIRTEWQQTKSWQITDTGQCLIFAFWTETFKFEIWLQFSLKQVLEQVETFQGDCGREIRGYCHSCRFIV